MEIKAFREKYRYDQATPVMQQYLDLKFNNFDCLVLFRMGDFYELFFEDAVFASKVLGITLTKRGKSGEDEIAMCGVPYHALENYLNKLLEEGMKVAICDQLETPEEAKKRGGYKAVVTREITRIFTPGTIIEESLLTTSAPSYLASLVVSKKGCAIAYVDISTSEIAVIFMQEHEVVNELSKLSPKEILVSEALRNSELVSMITIGLGLRLTYQVDSFFAKNKCEKIIHNFYKILSLRAIGELVDEQVSAIGGVLEYLILTQKHNLPILPLPKLINIVDYLTIDHGARRNLEITRNLSGTSKGSLLGTIDHTVTKAGSRLLYNFLLYPLTDIEEINKRLKITEFFKEHFSLTQTLIKILKEAPDVERSVSRISMKRGTPQDLLYIKSTLIICSKIKSEFLFILGVTIDENIQNLISSLITDDELYDLLDESIIDDSSASSIDNGGFIRHNYHPKVKELQEMINDGKSLIERLRTKYQQETGIDSLKISHNNVIGLFVEVTPRNTSKMNDEKFVHKQTTITSVRYTTLELQKLESEMISAKKLCHCFRTGTIC